MIDVDMNLEAEKIKKPIAPSFGLNSRKMVIYILVDNCREVENSILSDFNSAISSLMLRIKETTTNDNTFVRILCVNHQAHWLSPMVSVKDGFEWEDIKKEDGFSGVKWALLWLWRELEKASRDKTYYWRHSILFFSGSKAEDDYDIALKSLLNNELFDKAFRVVISVGDTNMEMLKAFSGDNVIVTKSGFRITFAEVWNNSCVVPSIFCSNTDNKKRLVEIEYDNRYEGIFRIEDSESDEENLIKKIGEIDGHLANDIILRFAEYIEEDDNVDVDISFVMRRRLAALFSCKSYREIFVSSVYFKRLYAVIAGILNPNDADFMPLFFSEKDFQFDKNIRDLIENDVSIDEDSKRDATKFVDRFVDGYYADIIVRYMNIVIWEVVKSFQEKKKLNPLSEIYRRFPDIIRDRQKLKALLMDYIPEEKTLINVLCLSFDENIPQGIQQEKTMGKIQVQRYKNRLINSYAISDEMAEKVVMLWVETLQKNK